MSLHRANRVSSRRWAAALVLLPSLAFASAGRARTFTGKDGTEYHATRQGRTFVLKGAQRKVVRTHLSPSVSITVERHFHHGKGVFEIFSKSLREGDHTRTYQQLDGGHVAQTRGAAPPDLAALAKQHPALKEFPLKLPDGPYTYRAYYAAPLDLKSRFPGRRRGQLESEHWMRPGITLSIDHPASAMPKAVTRTIQLPSGGSVTRAYPRASSDVEVFTGGPLGSGRFKTRSAYRRKPGEKLIWE